LRCRKDWTSEKAKSRVIGKRKATGLIEIAGLPDEEGTRLFFVPAGPLDGSWT